MAKLVVGGVKRDDHVVSYCDSKTLFPQVEEMWTSNDSSLKGKLKELGQLYTLKVIYFM